MIYIRVCVWPANDEDTMFIGIAGRCFPLQWERVTNMGQLRLCVCVCVCVCAAVLTFGVINVLYFMCVCVCAPP